MLNYHALYYLIEIVQAGSFTLAAEKLHITRPALSTAIKNLENDLGFSLLNRRQDGVTLTEQGKLVVQLAEKGFAQFNDIELLKQNTHEIPEEISIYSTQALTSSFLPTLVGLYYEQYPEGKFNLYAIDNLTPDEILLKHPNSIVFGIFNETRIFADYVQAIVLDKSKSYIAMNKTATLLPPNVKSITIRDLLHIPLITTSISEEQSFQTELLTLIRRYGEPNIRMNVTSIGMSPLLVAQDLGATLFISFKKYLTDMHSNNYRLVSIKNAPKFILAALHNKNLSQKKLNYFLNLLERSKLK